MCEICEHKTNESACSKCNPPQSKPSEKFFPPREAMAQRMADWISANNIDSDAARELIEIVNKYVKETIWVSTHHCEHCTKK